MLGAIALLTMLVRAIVPAGYMLAEAETVSGRYVTIQMCTEHTQSTRVLDVKSGRMLDPDEAPKTDKSDKSSNNTPCVFAAIAPLAPPVADVSTVEFVTVSNVEFAQVRDVAPGRGLPAPPPPATGPPVSI